MFNYFDVMEIFIKEGEGFDLVNLINDCFKVFIDE